MVVEHLERTRDAFLAATRGLSDAQYRFKQAADCWSIAEIVEHVALVESRITENVAAKMPDGPAPTAEKLTGPARFERLERVVGRRGERRTSAPDAFRPVGTWPTVAASLAAFSDARKRSLALAAAAGPDVCQRVLPSRAFGELDLEEWLYFASLHAERHTEQIDEVKRAPHFPA